MYGTTTLHFIGIRLWWMVLHLSFGACGLVCGLDLGEEWSWEPALSARVIKLLAVFNQTVIYCERDLKIEKKMVINCTTNLFKWPIFNTLCGVFPFLTEWLIIAIFFFLYFADWKIPAPHFGDDLGRPTRRSRRATHEIRGWRYRGGRIFRFSTTPATRWGHSENNDCPCHRDEQ